MYHRYHRSLTALLAVLLLLVLPCTALASPSDYNVNAPESLVNDQLYGDAAVVMDSSNGNILLDKNAQVRMYPASTTKMMTLLLACESGFSMDMEITIPQEAADVPADSSLVPVYPGETMAFGDLLYGMMMHSGNDGANAIAVLVGGSIDNFVRMMNERAAAIGCTGTHFVNAHGYHDENHYTTALDLARIAQAAMKNEQFRTISQTYKRTITIDSKGSDRVVELTNKCVLLNPDSDYYLNGCIGIKTGSHSAAGQCFVGAIDRDDVLLITVSLKCSTEDQKWIDTIRMSRYGYTRYSDYSIEQMFEMITPQLDTTRVANAKTDDPNGGVLRYRLASVSDPEYMRKIQSNDPSALTSAMKDFASRITVTLDRTPVAPITEGQALGTFTYTKQNGDVITAVLISASDIEKQPEYPALFDILPFLKIFLNPLVTALAIVLLLIILAIFLALRARRIREQKRRAELYRRRRSEYHRRDQARARAAAKRPAAGPRTAGSAAARTRSTSAGTGRAPQRPASRPAQGAARMPAQATGKKPVRRKSDDLFDTFED